MLPKDMKPIFLKVTSLTLQKVINDVEVWRENFSKKKGELEIPQDYKEPCLDGLNLAFGTIIKSFKAEKERIDKNLDKMTRGEAELEARVEELKQFLKDHKQE